MVNVAFTVFPAGPCTVIAMGVFFPAATFVVARPEPPGPLSDAVAVTWAGHAKPAR